ncbi:zinc-ribbon domain-containing protein, partial [Porcipelethomonas sp.]|uniref:zinc-ribbon domain-containing protein n=1 Tax=Porcipelethomonas sp. TaxID=2981675 RepID=UPI003EF7E2B5
MRCNKCGAELKPGAKFCTNCGNKNIVQNSFSGGGKACPNCGKEIKDNKKFCTSCGMKLPESSGGKKLDLKIDDNMDINMLYKRAFMYLEDGCKDEAHTYFEHFLDRNPEDATAFYGRLMLDLGFDSEDDFKKLDKDIRENKNFKRAYRYGDEALKNKLDEYVHISFCNMLKAAGNLDQLERTKERLIRNGAENIENDYESCRNKILDEMYNIAVERRKKADSPESIRFAYNSFVEVGDYKDAVKQSGECLETEKQMIKDAETDKIYQDAVKIKDDAASGVLPDYKFEISLKKAIAAFEQLGDYKDSQKYLNVCNRILSSYNKVVTDTQPEIKESSPADSITEKLKLILKQIKDLFLKKKIIIISSAVILTVIIAVIIFFATRSSGTQSNDMNNSLPTETEVSETVPETETTSETTTIFTSQTGKSEDDIKA